MTDGIDELVETVMREQHAATQRGVLSMWTIYHRPADWPGGYIARRFEVGRGNPEPVPTASHLAGADDALAMLRHVFEAAGLTCLRRRAEDHESVVETWT